MIGNEVNDIVVLYAPPFDHPAQLSKHHFAKLWSKSRRVLFVESPINPLSFFTRKEEAKVLWGRFRKGPIQFDKNLWVTSFFYLLPYRGSRFLLGGRWVNALNQFFIINKLKAQIEALKLNNPILFIGSAHAHPLLKYFNYLKKVYHCSDDYTLISSFPDSFEQLEISLMKKCDLIVTTADELMKVKSKYNSNIISIPNGANVKHFFKTQKPSTKVARDIIKFKNPIVGYIGSIFQWLDTDWIKYAAESCPSYDFIFIGPITIDISRLEKIKNIYFLGAKPYQDLPRFMKAFRVAVIPFVIDGVTLKASPIKFYEYLASGIPIVSTELPDLLNFNKISYLVKDKKSYVKAIRLAVNEKSHLKIKNRMEVAKNFSWNFRFEILNNEINKLM